MKGSCASSSHSIVQIVIALLKVFAQPTAGAKQQSIVAGLGGQKSVIHRNPNLVSDYFALITTIILQKFFWKIKGARLRS